LRTTQALAEESCIQSALYASISRNNPASNAILEELLKEAGLERSTELLTRELQGED
jgi:hypothetical protein